MRTTLFLLLAFSCSAIASEKQNLPPVEVACSDTEIEIKNTGAKSWAEITIYLNGDPPGGYKLTARAPKIGEKARFSFSRFVDKQGNRFDPVRLAPVKVWIGGGGYDFEKYNVRR